MWDEKLNRSQVEVLPGIKKFKLSYRQHVVVLSVHFLGLRTQSITDNRKALDFFLLLFLPNKYAPQIVWSNKYGYK